MIFTIGTYWKWFCFKFVLETSNYKNALKLFYRKNALSNILPWKSFEMIALKCIVKNFILKMNRKCIYNKNEYEINFSGQMYWKMYDKNILEMIFQ